MPSTTLKLLFLFLLFKSSIATATYGVQLTQSATADQTKCLLNNRYTRIWPRVFQSNGEVDFAGLTTLQVAERNGLQAFGGYMVPQVTNSDGAGQVDKLDAAFRKYNIYGGLFAIQITRDSAPWPSNQTANVALINSLIKRANQLDHFLEINTTIDDWIAITGNIKTLYKTPNLWYINVYRDGVTGETPQSFDDFQRFGPWAPGPVAAKTFGINEIVCGLKVNRIYYAY